MKSVVAVLLALAVCVPDAAQAESKVRAHIAAGRAFLANKQFIKASIEFRLAEEALFDEPSDEAANAVHDGYARVDAGLIEAAVETESKVRGDDAKRLEELHRLRLRLRAIGGNPALETRIADAMNIRASLLITPHEAATTLTDITPLLALGKYPELDESNRKRIGALILKTFRTYRARAESSAPELVRRTFEGLAATWSGKPISDGRAVRDRELASFARGTRVSITTNATNCGELPAALSRLNKTGAYQVDAEVNITACRHKQDSTSQQVTESYIDRVPYQALETFEEQSCVKTKVPVSYCLNPYTKTGCVSSSDTADSYSCGWTTKTAMVTKYAEVPKTRMVTRTTTYDRYGADLQVTLIHAGKRVAHSMTVNAELVNRQGKSLADVAIGQLEAALEVPVKATIDARAVELRAQADAAIAAGRIDDAELGYLRVLFLNRDAGDYFQRTYAMTPAQLRSALEAHGDGKAIAVASPEALPAVTDERRDQAISFVRDRFASTFPPALARVRGFWYQIELGAVSVEDRGVSPTFTIRLGSPVLSRLHRRTRGVGIWDDASFGGGMGYNATTADGVDRARVFVGIATYTAAAGIRVARFQLLGGARATAFALKNGETTGSSLALSYWANAAVQVGKPSLSLEVWQPTGRGDDTRGAQVYMTVKTPKAQYQSASGSTIPTSYLALRAQEQLFDALRVRDFMVLFGAGFR